MSVIAKAPPFLRRDVIVDVPPSEVITMLAETTTPERRTVGFGTEPDPVSDRVALVGAVGLFLYLYRRGYPARLHVQSLGSDGGHDLAACGLTIDVKASQFDGPLGGCRLFVKEHELEGEVPDVYWQVFVHCLDQEDQHVHVATWIRTDDPVWIAATKNIQPIPGAGSPGVVLPLSDCH